MYSSEDKNHHSFFSFKFKHQSFKKSLQNFFFLLDKKELIILHRQILKYYTKKKLFYILRYDDTLYPNIAQCLGNRKAVVFKITMDVFAKSIEAKDDLRTFVWDFGQEHNQVCIVYCIYFFRQITTFIKVHVVYVFGLQTL